MGNIKETKVVIDKDKLTIGDRTFEGYFLISEIIEFLGSDYREYLYPRDDDSEPQRIEHIWDNLGISAGLADGSLFYEHIIFRVNDYQYKESDPKSIFAGQIFIQNNEYHDANMKFDVIHQKKLGNISINTFLINELDNQPESRREFLKSFADYFRVFNKVPNEESKKIKTNKYKLSSCDAPLVFKNFNFKLLVIEELMYNQKLLKPEFDVNEFVEEYSHRDIDIDEEGYEEIKEVKNWFKKLEIPRTLADKVENLLWDGGNSVYTQIIPFWDGEDDYYNVKSISPEELLQFRNLKIVDAGSGFSKKAIKTLEDAGIKVVF